MEIIPKVSVIVPSYKQAVFLPEALDSVLAQTYQHWECIIINDGSPDDTEEVALKYCEKDLRIKYILKQNGGHSSARNLGIAKCSGKYILPLDGDDKIDVAFIEKAVEIMEAQNHVKVVAGNTQLFGDKNELIKLPAYNFKNLLEMNFLYNSSMYRKEDFNQTKGYDETMLGFEDWDIWISLLENGGEVIVLPFTTYFYRIRQVSVYQDFLKDNKRVFRDLLRIYTNHKDAYEKYFGNPINLLQENEKMKRVIAAYQQSFTYRVGSRLNALRHFFTKSNR